MLHLVASMKAPEKPCRVRKPGSHYPENRHDPDVIARPRTRPLVQHAVGKCERCGSTLRESPLPHECNPTERPVAIEAYQSWML